MTSPSPVQVGAVLAGKYKIERVLGSGGMGVVVAARHLQLDERVAIKLLLPEAVSRPALVARFLREGRAAVKIRSEHVARVFDVGTLDNGSPYMVMEYLEGSDLAVVVREHGPLPIDLALELVLQACEAMAEAHVNGVVHRDLKPGNLFLTTRADGTPCVKVIDFGISKVAEVSRGEMEITGTLEARGSPLFMSPEQMVSTRDVDARSDIWSLGVTLYHLLTGEYPFQAPTMPQICGLVLTAEPEPLDPRLPDAPPGLEAALFGCLEKDPGFRYQNVGELAAALAPFASPSARVSVERITRVIASGGVPQARVSAPTAGYFQGASPRPQGSSPQAAPDPRVPLAEGSDPGRRPRRDHGAPRAGSGATSSTAVVPGSVTSGATSLPVRPRPESSARPPKALVIAVGVSGVLLAVGLTALTFVLLRGEPFGAPSPSPQTPELASPGERPKPATPGVVLASPPAATGVPQVTAAATTTVAATAPPAFSAKPVAQPPVLVRTPPLPRPKQSPDLFDTPK